MSLNAKRSMLNAKHDTSTSLKAPIPRHCVPNLTEKMDPTGRGAAWPSTQGACWRGGAWRGAYGVAGDGVVGVVQVNLVVGSEKN